MVPGSDWVFVPFLFTITAHFSPFRLNLRIITYFPDTFIKSNQSDAYRRLKYWSQNFVVGVKLGRLLPSQRQKTAFQKNLGQRRRDEQLCRCRRASC